MSADLEKQLAELRKHTIFQAESDLHPELREKLFDALADGLRELDSLPRTDPFWVESNRCVTLHKLDDFESQKRRCVPSDEQAYWRRAGLDLYYGCNDFGFQSWCALHRMGKLKFQWPVQAAYYVWASSGFNTASMLVDLAREGCWMEQLRACLVNVEQQHGADAAWWLNEVEHNMEQDAPKW